MTNLIGQQFGNYRLTRQLGTGGFGEVYLGKHIHLQREAAIKILLKLGEQDIELFRTEAQIISNLVHPHIVTLFDYDVAQGQPFLVMMYAEKGTMRQRYRHGTQAPLAEVVKYISQAADGLQFAHDNHILHRDVKPVNMLLGPSEQLLLSDFGLAVIWSNTSSLNKQDIIGTRGYMAPEQFMGQPRPASDQYALAIAAYEWLSGSLPMAHTTLGLGMMQLTNPETSIPPVSSMAPHVPPRVDEVLQRALASDWQARYPSVRVFAEELARASSRQQSALANLSTSAFSAGQLPAHPLPNNSRSTIPWNSAAASNSAPGQARADSQATIPWHNTPAPATPSYAPPPPPPPYARMPPRLNTDPQLFPYPGSAASKPRPLVLPVTRTRSQGRVWLWFAGYNALLFILDAPLAWLVAIHENSAVPGGFAFLMVCDCFLLIPLFTTLAGALLGKWRGALVPPAATFLWLGLVVILASLHSSGNTSTAESTGGNGWLTGIAIVLCFTLPSVTAFVTGWIYQRRRRAQFGWSFLSQLAGLSLLLIPLIILLAIAESSGSSLSDIAINVITVGLLIVGIAPLALFASGLETLIHSIVKRSTPGLQT